MVITDALEMKRSGPIDEDVTRFIETYDLDEGAYSIVANIDTQMRVAPYDPHDFDMKEFIKWNVGITLTLMEIASKWMRVVENTQDIVIICLW